MTDLGRVEDYSWERPKALPPTINLTSYHAAKYVLEHQDTFHTTFCDGFEWVWGERERNFILSGDNAKQKQIMAKVLYREKWHQQVKDFYEYTTLRLLHGKSYKLAGVNEVDITRE
jgi:linoleate 10R-lipoxygenase